MSLAIFGPFLAAPGPGMVTARFYMKNDYQIRDQNRNPWPGRPFRGHFPFLEKVYVGGLFMWFCFCLEKVPSKNGSGAEARGGA